MILPVLDYGISFPYGLSLENQRNLVAYRYQSLFIAYLIICCCEISNLNCPLFILCILLSFFFFLDKYFTEFLTSKIKLIAGCSVSSCLSWTYECWQSRCKGWKHYNWSKFAGGPYSSELQILYNITYFGITEMANAFAYKVREPNQTKKI